MSDYAYKPRFGYDIRVKPPRGEDEPPVWAAAHTRLCQAPGCLRKAALKLAASPRQPQQKIWLCAAHAAEHNRNWNFFDGLSDAEAEAARLAGLYGDRPTWTMGKNDRARAAARARGAADFHDAFGLFGEAARRQASHDGRMRDGRVLPKLQVQAFETLGLRVTASATQIRQRYAELVRRYHPDTNGGDRSAETQLTAVVKAHQILKKAGIC
ncbi:MAG: DnaJ domain-containing protein [Alphaproteobacteria bacterium]|nr:DnaJ domain-containing protein [Alphaproteobacteria bacterium]